MPKIEFKKTYESKIKPISVEFIYNNIHNDISSHTTLYSQCISEKLKVFCCRSDAFFLLPTLLNIQAQALTYRS